MGAVFLVDLKQDCDLNLLIFKYMDVNVLKLLSLQFGKLAMFGLVRLGHLSICQKSLFMI